MVPRRDLFWHQAKPGAEVAALGERILPIAATIALEMIGPMPGTVINRSQPRPDRPAL